MAELDSSVYHFGVLLFDRSYTVTPCEAKNRRSRPTAVFDQSMNFVAAVSTAVRRLWPSLAWCERVHSPTVYAYVPNFIWSISCIALERRKKPEFYRVFDFNILWRRQLTTTNLSLFSGIKIVSIFKLTDGEVLSTISTAQKRDGQKSNFSSPRRDIWAIIWTLHYIIMTIENSNLRHSRVVTMTVSCL